MTEASSIHGKYKPAEQVDKLIIISACETDKFVNYHCFLSKQQKMR
jgi:hypothetical protein